MEKLAEEQRGEGIEEADTDDGKPILKSFVRHPLSELGTMVYQANTKWYGFVTVHRLLLIQLYSYFLLVSRTASLESSERSPSPLLSH